MGTLGLPSSLGPLRPTTKPKTSPLTLHQDPDQQDDAQQDKENVQAHDGSVQPTGGLGGVQERPGPGWGWGRGRAGDLQALNTTTPTFSTD